MPIDDDDLRDLVEGSWGFGWALLVAILAAALFWGVLCWRWFG